MSLGHVGPGSELPKSLGKKERAAGLLQQSPIFRAELLRDKARMAQGLGASTGSSLAQPGCIKGWGQGTAPGRRQHRG